MRNLFATFVGRFLKFYADFQCCLTRWSAAQYCTLCATRSNNALKNAKRHDLWVSAVVGGLLGPHHTFQQFLPKVFSIPLEQRNQSHFENITFQCLFLKTSFSDVDFRKILGSKIQIQWQALCAPALVTRHQLVKSFSIQQLIEDSKHSSSEQQWFIFLESVAVMDKKKSLLRIWGSDELCL